MKGAGGYMRSDSLKHAYVKGMAAARASTVSKFVDALAHSAAALS